MKPDSSGLPCFSLAGRAGVAWNERQVLVDRLARATSRDRDRWRPCRCITACRQRRMQLVAAVTRYHASHPLEDGMPREELRERVFADASPPGVRSRPADPRRDAIVIVARDRVALAGHNVALTDDEARAREAMIEILRAAALAPPDPADAGRRGSGCRWTSSTASRRCSSGGRCWSASAICCSTSQRSSSSRPRFSR